MDGHDDRFTDEHARKLSAPSETEWQHHLWLTYADGPCGTVKGTMQRPPTMHDVCDPANDEGGAWSLYLGGVPHPFAPMVQAGVVCKIKTDGPLDAYPVLSRLVNEGRSSAFQPRCLRVEGQATMEELFDA